MESGIPDFQLPWQFNVNSTAGEDLEGPFEVASDMWLGIVMVALVSLLQHMAIAKFYCRKLFFTWKNGFLFFIRPSLNVLSAPSRQVDASQELIALGSCQIVGSFFGSMPVTASFGRSAVNAASGARTTFNGIITGLIIILACAVLTPHFAYIPTASLAAVIISSMIFTIEVEILLPLWRAKSKLAFYSVP